jgi:hypothetical protein
LRPFLQVVKKRIAYYGRNKNVTLQTPEVSEEGSREYMSKSVAAAQLEESKLDEPLQETRRMVREIKARPGSITREQFLAEAEQLRVEMGLIESLIENLEHLVAMRTYGAAPSSKRRPKAK